MTWQLTLVPHKVVGTLQMLHTKRPRARLLLLTEELSHTGSLQRWNFSVVPRGYRADQVDAALAECQAEIDRLRAQQDPHAQRPQDTER